MSPQTARKLARWNPAMGLDHSPIVPRPNGPRKSLLPWVLGIDPRTGQRKPVSPESPLRACWECLNAYAEDYANGLCADCFCPF